MKLSSIVSLVAVSIVAATMAVAQRKESAAMGNVQDVAGLNPTNNGETLQLILRQNVRFDIHREIDRESWHRIPHLFTEWVTSADAFQET